MRLFDTHAHLNTDIFDDQLDYYLDLASVAGVQHMCCIGIDYPTSLKSIRLARQYPQICATVGVHPNSAHEATDGQWNELVDLASRDEVVAIGETGLDLYWDFCPLAVQQAWFERHIELSYQLQKPLIIHVRETEQLVLEQLSRQCRDGKILGVLHSFVGCWETAAQALDWGMYISFSGILTYKKSDELRQVAAKIPLDRLLIETDAPYLAPQQHRGKRPNHPAWVVHVADILAEIHGKTVEEMAEITTENGLRFFQKEC